MQNQDLTITDLDEHAQLTALTDFVHFYLEHYRTNDLEILSQFKVDYAMNDINMYLYANRNFSPDQLAAGVLAYKKNLFLEILKTINLPFNENGSLKEKTWDGWYQQEYAKIPEGK
ncbi:hypothetical protein [Levilactobacillus sp. HBUAS70063]|uniref:hypothetical protein n=1 Tax=Levilactobacillus sp. HBUAS70063 TaxID=3109359 RepID=UPI0031333B57